MKETSSCTRFSGSRCVLVDENSFFRLADPVLQTSFLGWRASLLAAPALFQLLADRNAHWAAHMIQCGHVAGGLQSPHPVFLGALPLFPPMSVVSQTVGELGHLLGERHLHFEGRSGGAIAPQTQASD